MPYRYRGPGHIPGIPARDLSDDEAQAYRVEGSPLYERERPPQRRGSVKPDPQAEFLREEETVDE